MLTYKTITLILLLFYVCRGTEGAGQKQQGPPVIKSSLAHLLLVCDVVQQGSALANQLRKSAHSW